MKKIIVWFLVLIGLVGVFFIGKYFYFNKTNYNRQYVPENAEFVIQLRTGKLVEDLLEGLLVSNRDEALYQSMRKLLDKQSAEMDDSGIQFKSDILLFSENKQGKQIVGILVNLEDQKTFEAFYTKRLAEQFYVKNDKRVALLLLKNDALDAANSKKYLASVMGTKRSDFKERFVSNDTGYLHFYNKDQNGKYLAINVDLIDNKIVVDGNIPYTKNDPNSALYNLKPKGFHLDSRIDANSFINDFVQTAFSKLLSAPQVDNFTFNYYGLELTENEERKLVVVPRFDLLLCFEENYSNEKLFDKSLFLDKLNWVRTDSTLQASQYSYNIKRLSDKVLFLGLSPDNIVSNTSHNSFELSGDLSNLLKIEGGGFIGSMLVSVIPGVRQTKAFLDQVEELEFASKLNSTDIHGEIVFKENQIAMNEMLRYLISFGE